MEGGGWVLGDRINGTQAEHVRAASTPTLISLITTGQLDASRFITHRFGMDEFEQAYEVFVLVFHLISARSGGSRRSARSRRFAHR